MTSLMKGRQWLHGNWLLVLLLTACAVRMWLMVLPSSFWTDETETAFIVRLAGDASLEAAQVPSSVYYALPRAAQRWFGDSEISYRMPSVLLMGIALFLVVRLAARLIDCDAGWFVVFVCFALPGLNYYAVDARPYALGVCVAAAALLFLVRWLDTADWKEALLFLLFAALLWRVQLAFWAFYPVFPIYTLLRLARGTTRVGWLHAVAIYALLGIALVPVGLEALRMLQTAGSHVISLVPGVRTLVGDIGVYPVICSFAFVLAAALWKRWRGDSRSGPRGFSFESGVLIASWWLLMPLTIWTYSIVSGTSIFVPRYFSPALPGSALAATAVVSLSLPPAKWKHAAAIVAVIALAVNGNWSEWWPNHAREIWREGARTERLLVREADTPVIAVSPFVEALSPVWRPDYFLPGFLYAPLFTYPLRGAVYPFPVIVTEEGQQYGAKLLGETLVPRGRFIVFGNGRLAMLWTSWFARRPELAGWSYQVHRDEGIETVVFEKHAEPLL